LQFTMRATEASSLADLEAKVRDCFLAGAVASGCDYNVDYTEPMYDALNPDPWLAETVRAEMTRLGRTPVEAELEAAHPVGSTDMGNVTQLLPGIHPMVAVDAGGASLHQPAFTAAAVGPSADRAVVEGAIMLARTVVRLAQAPDQRDRVLAARDQRAAS
jgi:metal-dependent amidase/aminoacylase/carboxypeptidase family protein